MGGRADGIAMESATMINSTGIGTNAATITINGIAANGASLSRGIVASVSTEINSVDGDIILNTDTINLNGIIQGTSTLTIQPLTPGVTIGVGGAATGTLELSNAELNTIQDGFVEIIFGRIDGTAAFEIGSYTFNDAVTMRSLTGTMTLVGSLATSGGEAIHLITDSMDLSLIHISEPTRPY